jgi:nucleotide-binding universal stress UspA family protein
MSEISKIVVPVVFSDNCRGAFCYGVCLARRFSAELAIVHVLEPLFQMGFDTVQGLQQLDECRRAWVRRSLHDLTYGVRHDVRLRELCLEGDAAREIVRFAEAYAADLIVMATHGHGPFRRFLLGSVTAKVLHDSACAVWTGAHLERGLAVQPPVGDFHDVVCAVDFGPETDAALAWSSALAKAYQARLSLIHVVSSSLDSKRKGAAFERARRQLDHRRQMLGGEAECHVIAGAVAQQLGDFVRCRDSSLLVIGRGSMSGGGRLRSTSYGILRECPCPVVSV